MSTKVIGIECAYSSSIVEIPLNDKMAVETGEEIVFKDAEDKEEYGIIRYVGREPVEKDKILFSSKILRKATPNDIQKVDSHIEPSKHALKKCASIIEKLGLDMVVFRAGYSLDGNRIHFMFTSDDRVDFRDLVKELAAALKKQIHLRQIGPRDKAKLIGGYGKCGRRLCCASWLNRLESINMEMVRVQALESKGSSKLSGSCGKLLCCLKYEVEAYKGLREKVPNIGSVVKIKGQGEGVIIALDILNQRVKVSLESGEFLIIDVKEIDKVVKAAFESAEISAVEDNS